MTLETRPASADDLPQVLALARRALGWTDVSPRFLEWKHLENPWGESFMWVATEGGEVVAFRAFLRWEFVRPDGVTVRARAAVDTATDPEFRRRGLFRTLTTEALDELTAQGVKLIWNTPNSSSLPGYLAMGWHEVGHPAVGVRPTSARFPFVVLTARKAAGRDAVATTFGRAAWEVFGDDADVDHLLGAAEAASPNLRPGQERLALTTRKTQAFLAWRYNNPALGYRVLLADPSPRSGLVVFRLRRRGSAVECVVCDLLVPAAATDEESDREGDGKSTASSLLDRLAHGVTADYLIRVEPRPGGPDPSGAQPTGRTRGVTLRRFVRLPRTGPVLACRPLDGYTPPELADWALTMGDIELL